MAGRKRQPEQPERVAHGGGGGSGGGGISSISTAPDWPTTPDGRYAQKANNLSDLSAVTARANLGVALSRTVATKTAAYTLSAGDGLILADATSGAFTVTLPTAAGNAGLRFEIKAVTTTTNLVTVATTGGQTIDGQATVSVGTPGSGAPYSAVTVASDGSNWRVA